MTAALLDMWLWGRSGHRLSHIATPCPKTVSHSRPQETSGTSSAVTTVEWVSPSEQSCKHKAKCYHVNCPYRCTVQEQCVIWLCMSDSEWSAPHIHSELDLPMIVAMTWSRLSVHNPTFLLPQFTTAGQILPAKSMALPCDNHMGNLQSKACVAVTWREWWFHHHDLKGSQWSFLISGCP